MMMPSLIPTLTLTTSSIYFDNFLITDNLGLADQLAQETFDLKQAADASANGNMFRRILDYR